MRHPLVRAALLFVGFIAGGALLFLFDLYEVYSPGLITAMLVAITLAKLTYFVGSILRWIRRSAADDVYRRHLLMFLFLNVLLIISSYAIDYYCLHRIRPESFHLPFGEQDPVGQLLTFFYFSTGRFTTAGGSEVYPTAGLAQGYVVSEILLSYCTTVLIVANISLLQTLLAPAKPPGPPTL
ncbi:hypothetical protein [Hymenobacter coccineus]|uniref:hypothetical protein n=1 Tax=Hymenobacter coccineus TaxID=1908235 RepID=UPI000F76C28B|nr:hypothetical protein [Hymenobacter coccineus]